MYSLSSASVYERQSLFCGIYKFITLVVALILENYSNYKSGGLWWNCQTWFVDEKLHTDLVSEMKPLFFQKLFDLSVALPGSVTYMVAPTYKLDVVNVH